MFTGIVEELGEVTAVEKLGDSSRFRLRGPVVTQGARHGDSIAVNGVCLTVVEHEDDWFTADVMAESLDRSSLGALTAGSRVNLERPMAVGDRLGGHIVQGHVDGTGEVIERKPSENWEIVRISLPAESAKSRALRRSPVSSSTSACAAARQRASSSCGVLAIEARNRASRSATHASKSVVTNAPRSVNCS